MKIRTSALSAGIVLLILSSVSGCGQKTSATTAANPAQETPFRPTASIKELMDAVIDPSADGVWNAVSTETSKKGLVENQPHTDEEWKAVRRHALTLIEATNLLLIEGRQVAPPGTKSEVKDELEPIEIQKLIDANRPAFIAHAHALHDVTTQALAAIDAKNAEALVTVGGNIDGVCEACHLQFWYPGQKIPVYPENKKATAKK